MPGEGAVTKRLLTKLYVSIFRINEAIGKLPYAELFVKNYSWQMCLNSRGKRPPMYYSRQALKSNFKVKYSTFA